MKKIILFISFTVFTFVSHSQISDSFSNSGMLIYTTKKTPESYTGSPYKEVKFLKGVIRDTNKDISQEALLRYNALEDVVEIRFQQNDKSSVLPKYKHIIYDMGDYTYYIDNLDTDNGIYESYILNFYESDNVKFVGRPTINLTEAKLAKTPYEKDRPADIKIELEYYISINGGKFKQTRIKEKDLEDIFNSDRMEDYFDDNKIKDEKDVVKMLKFYDSQTS